MLDFQLSDLSKDEQLILASSVASPVLISVFRKSKENIEKQLLSFYRLENETLEDFAIRHETLRVKHAFYGAFLEKIDEVIKLTKV